MLLHYHIPKTGGMSLNRALGASFAGMSRLGISYDQNIQAELIRTRKQDVVASHWPFGAHFRCPEPRDTVTVLRQPLKRTLSYYHFMLKEADKRPKGHPVTFLKGADLNTFISSWPAARNGMTRQLAGLPINSKVPASYGMLDDAIANLKKITYVGFTHSLEALVERITLNLPIKVGGVPHINSTNYSHLENQSEEVVDLLKSVNYFDLLLYEEAERLFLC